MKGHPRAIVGQLTIEQLVKEPELVSARLREPVGPDVDKLAFEVVSFALIAPVDEPASSPRPIPVRKEETRTRRRAP